VECHLISTTRVATSTYTVVPLEKLRVYFQRLPGTRVFGGEVGSPSCVKKRARFVGVFSDKNIMVYQDRLGTKMRKALRIKNRASVDPSDSPVGHTRATSASRPASSNRPPN
jgi:hypothetical protein